MHLSSCGHTGRVRPAPLQPDVMAEWASPWSLLALQPPRHPSASPHSFLFSAHVLIVRDGPGRRVKGPGRETC